jgi:hypothetical protein
MRSRFRMISPAVAAFAVVASLAAPSPAATVTDAPAPKVKESTALAGEFRAPRAGVSLRPPDSTTRLGFCGGDDW